MNLSYFCSRKCNFLSKTIKIKCLCKHCGIETIKKPSDIKKVKNIFCSSSCAATYRNIHKTKGTRRSKLEVYLEKRIKEIYGEDFALFNNKDIINSELDIYIPSLKLAIEINGIFHYEPIFGEIKLNSIKNNDARKIQACIENKISFCVIDTTSMSYFKESKADSFLNIIQDIIKTHKNNIIGGS